MENSLYWVDQIVDRIIKDKGEKSTYVIASGITPSGSIHIGNFREEMTVELVARALKERGYKVRYIHSWDNYDRYRKVPGNVPKEWEKYIGMPVSQVPDPWKCHESYGRHFEDEFEKSAKVLDVNPEYLSQTKIYQKCTYKDGIKTALIKNTEIKEILNKYRKEPLKENWYPVEVYCGECGHDSTKITGYDGGYGLSYECNCGFSEKVDFSKKGIVKLRWRTDWAMRWAYHDEDFEPAGKDHSTPGGSRDTSKEVCERIYDFQAPTYQMYDFVLVKGAGGKISSSKGNVVIPAQLNEIYLPEIVRFFYAGTRPKSEFAIAMDDEEVFKNYEDFYFAERVYFNEEKVDKKKEAHLKRVYEMSVIGKIPKKMPIQIPFKYALTLAQLYNEDKLIIERLNKTGHISKKQEKDPRLPMILDKARNWAKTRAPPEYIYELQHKKLFEPSQEQKDAIKILLKNLSDLKETTLYDVGNSTGLKGDFFKLCYNIILNRDKGPRLFELVDVLGKEKIKELFEKYV